MPIINDFYDDEKRAKKRKKKENKQYAKERDRNFVKLLEDQQILHLAECDSKVALQLIKTYKKEYRNITLINEIEEIWETQTLDKDTRYRIVTICIFNPDLFKAQRREFLQGNIPESSVGLNEKSRYIIETLITTAFELPYRIWPYWKNINEMTLSAHFDYWNQKFAEGNDEHFFRGAGSITNKPLQNHILKTAKELGAKPVPKKKKYWFEFEIDVDDIAPFNGMKYEITLPNGSKNSGVINNNKVIRFENIPENGKDPKFRWVDNE